MEQKRESIKESSVIRSTSEAFLEMKCPSCGNEGMKEIVSVLDLPFLGEAVETTLICPKCSFKTSDVMITSQNEAVRYVMRVEKPEDINARVVRSTSGTIRIPELGVSIEPGPASESFISNIEGVLARVKGVLEGLEYDKKEEVKNRLEELDKAREGKKRFTFIIEDPFGNSAVLDKKAKKEALSPEEATELKTGKSLVLMGEKV